ncbi:MAG: hypothetical protein Q7R41_03675, partial [Phycisphaerales bacterium]|nr:hypothetical protein [Phycisphaerales bacterium]
PMDADMNDPALKAAVKWINHSSGGDAELVAIIRAAYADRDAAVRELLDAIGPLDIVGEAGERVLEMGMAEERITTAYARVRELFLGEEPLLDEGVCGECGEDPCECGVCDKCGEDPCECKSEPWERLPCYKCGQRPCKCGVCAECGATSVWGGAVEAGPCKTSRDSPRACGVCETCGACLTCGENPCECD